MRRFVCFMVASLLGAGVLVFITGESQPVEHAGGPPTATIFLKATQSRPSQHGETEIGGNGGETKAEPARGNIAGATEHPAQVPPPRPQPPPTQQARRKTVERTENRSPVDQVKIYVYDDVPALDYSGLIQCFRDRNDDVPPWQEERADTAQDMAEIWLHRAILSHPWRVLDPDEADLFYVPIYPVLSFKVELGGATPFATKTLAEIDQNRCEGLTHKARMDAAVEFLSMSSPFFNRFGGADHVLVCAWWNCKNAVGSFHRMLLRRTVIAINEHSFRWCRWGCGDRKMVTVPYTASSVLTTTSMIGGRVPEDRDIPFLFVGAARHRPERTNLDVVQNISEDSIILLGTAQSGWGMNSTVYAEHMARSRFCFCPRGDTETSRHIFDAIAAGCIPIVTNTGVAALPYVGTGLNYSEFVIVVNDSGFSSREGVKNTTLDVLARSDEQLAGLRSRLRTAMSSVMYGVTQGARISDMQPFLGTATKFLQTAYAHARGGGGQGGTVMWDCPETHLTEAQLAPRTEFKLPPVPWQRRMWLAESETIVNKERSLLFCAPPNTGSLQFRMLAKRMQGVSHWSVSDDWARLFDPKASELELLDVTDGALMKEIYRDNNSGWIKVAVVRDPVTRLLSAYLDVVRTWRTGLQKQNLQSSPSSPVLIIRKGSAAQQQQQSWDTDDKHRLRRLRQTEEEEHTGHVPHDEQKETRKIPLGGAGSEWDLFRTILDSRPRQRQGDTSWSRGNGLGEIRHDANGHRRTGAGNGGAGSGPEREGANTWSDGGYRRLQNGEGGYEETALDNRQLHGRRSPQRDNTAKSGQDVGEEEEEGSRGWDGLDAGARRRAAEGSGDDAKPDGGVGVAIAGGDPDQIPTLAEVVGALEGDLWNAPAAFRPLVSLCGQKHSPFDSAIPFERLQKTSTEVLKSLPGGLWESFGASGWGPDGKHAFMEFDFGGSAWRRSVGVRTEDEEQERRDRDPLPRRASDLFEGESCAWAEYFGDMETLDAVGKLYASDYSHFRWYQLAPWRERLQKCINRKKQ